MKQIAIILAPKERFQFYQTVEVQSKITDENTYEDWLIKKNSGA